MINQTIFNDEEWTKASKDYEKRMEKIRIEIERKIKSFLKYIKRNDNRNILYNKLKKKGRRL